MGKTIGIDLGTTNSCMAVLEGGEPTVIENAEGARTTPSVVAFTDGGERLVGAPAKRQAVTNPENTVFSIKRFMGRKEAEVKEEEKIVPFEVAPGPNGDARVKAGGKEYAPPEISAMILQKLKADAEAYLGDTVDSAVITVPAYFNDDQRQATKDAGKVAGLDVKRIINEPTAASLAYGLDKEEDQTILVFDLGGGTFDVSVLEIGDGVFEVKATAGDNHLGGDNFDKAIVDWLVAEFKKAEGVDLSADKMALQRLYQEAEKAKTELSSAQETQINLPFITAVDSVPKHLNQRLTRSKLNELTADLLDRVVGPTKQALKDAGVEGGAGIDHVVLVGGMTRMPAVQEKVKELTGKDPHRGVNPDEVVAVGAAIQAGVLAGDVKDVLLLDVTPLTLGIETKGGVMTKLIERNTTIPTRKSEIFSTAEDNQPSVEVHVLQGEREMAAYNKSLGKFQLTGIPPAPRGIPQIEVTFDIDANGILAVGAKDLGTGKEQKIEIKAGSGLADEEVERMVKDAEAHAEDDRRQREIVETRNAAENAAYQAERQVTEMGDSLDSSSKEEIEAAIKDVRDNLESEDVELLKQKTDALQGAFHKVSEQMYAAAQQQARGRQRRLRRRRGRGGRLRRGGGRGRRGRRRRGAFVADDVRDREADLAPEEEPVTSRDEAGEPSGEEDPANEEERIVEDETEEQREEQPEDYLALAQRIQADFENYRKRVARETAAAGERARSGLVRELLPIVDNLERALASAEEGEQHLAEGVRLVHSELIAVLERNGVQQFDPAGDKFDPSRARGAVGEERRASRVWWWRSSRRGYRSNGTVLRPARVVVSG